MVDKYDKEIQERLIEVQVKFYQSHNQQQNRNVTKLSQILNAFCLTLLSWYKSSALNQSQSKSNNKGISLNFQLTTQLPERSQIGKLRL